MYQETNGVPGDGFPGNEATAIRFGVSENGNEMSGNGRLQEQIDLLQEDVELLKSEIKQTLVDLREVVMKERTVSIDYVDQPPVEIRQPSHGGTNRSAPGTVAPATQGDLMIGGAGPESEKVDIQPTVRGTRDVIRWVMDVREAGLSLWVLTLFLGAYERSNELSGEARSMVRFAVGIIKEMEIPDASSPESSVPLDAYAEYITRFGQIVPGSSTEQATTPGQETDRTDFPGNTQPVGGQPEPDIKTTEDNRGQGDSHGLVNNSVGHRCDYCDEWHNSGDK